MLLCNWGQLLDYVIKQHMLDEAHFLSIIKLRVLGNFCTYFFFLFLLIQDNYLEFLALSFRIAAGYSFTSLKAVQFMLFISLLDVESY